MAPRPRAYPPPKVLPEEVPSPVAIDDGIGSDVATILGENAASACKSSSEASGDGASSSEQTDSGGTDCNVCTKVLRKIQPRYKKQNKHHVCGRMENAAMRVVSMKGKKFAKHFKSLKKSKPDKYAKIMLELGRGQTGKKYKQIDKKAKANLVDFVETAERVKSLNFAKGHLMPTKGEFVKHWEARADTTEAKALKNWKNELARSTP